MARISLFQRRERNPSRRSTSSPSSWANRVCGGKSVGRLVGRSVILAPQSQSIYNSPHHPLPPVLWEGNLGKTLEDDDDNLFHHTGSPESSEGGLSRPLLVPMISQMDEWGREKGGGGGLMCGDVDRWVVWEGDLVSLYPAEEDFENPSIPQGNSRMIQDGQSRE